MCSRDESLRTGLITKLTISKLLKDKKQLTPTTYVYQSIKREVEVPAGPEVIRQVTSGALKPIIITHKFALSHTLRLRC